MMDSRILHFFGGKGGVGKTTLATAFSLNLAEKAPDEKVLLISLDTSKALSDLLKKKLPEKPFRVGNGNHHGLFVAELDRTTTLEPFRAKNKAACPAELPPPTTATTPPAQAWPQRPVKFIVSLGPGSGVEWNEDAIARALA